MIAHDAVANGGGASALGVTENGEAGVHLEGVANPAGEVVAHFDTLGDDGDEVGASFFFLLAQAFSHDVEVVFDFGDEANFSSASESAHGCEVAAMTTHDFDNEGTGKGAGGIADGVDGIENDIERGIDAEAVVGAGNIVVDGGRDAGEGDFEVGVELMKSVEGAVAADDHELADSFFFEVVIGDFAHGMVEKALGA